MPFETPCDVCHIGLMQPRRVTYAARVGESIVLLPGMNMFMCDVCNESIYDPEIVARIEMLLGINIQSSIPARRSEASGDVSVRGPYPSQRRRSV